MKNVKLFDGEKKFVGSFMKDEICLRGLFRGGDKDFPKCY
jgi:hypothetical protein